MANWHKIFDLHGKIAVVAGGAGLIGASICQILADAGATVVIIDHDADLAKQQSDRLSEFSPSAVIAEPIDITDEHEVRRASRRILSEIGPYDILVNAAHFKGGAFFADLENYPLDAWQQVVDVNLTGTFLMCREFGGVMNAGDGGVIVNISSTYGIVSADPRIYDNSGINSPISYAATKSGIINFTRYLAIHWRPKIRANVLVPGGVESGQDSQFIQNYSDRTPLGRMAKQDEYQGAILFMCSQASAYMTGAVVTIDGGWTAW